MTKDGDVGPVVMNLTLDGFSFAAVNCLKPLMLEATPEVLSWLIGRLQKDTAAVADSSVADLDEADVDVVLGDEADDDDDDDDEEQGLDPVLPAGVRWIASRSCFRAWNRRTGIMKEFRPRKAVCKRSSIEKRAEMDNKIAAAVSYINEESVVEAICT